MFSNHCVVLDQTKQFKDLFIRRGAVVNTPNGQLGTVVVIKPYTARPLLITWHDLDYQITEEKYSDVYLFERRASGPGPISKIWFINMMITIKKRSLIKNILLLRAFGYQSSLS